jgi:hypothetical protein
MLSRQEGISDFWIVFLFFRSLQMKRIVSRSSLILSAAVFTIAGVGGGAVRAAVVSAEGASSFDLPVAALDIDPATAPAPATPAASESLTAFRPDSFAKGAPLPFHTIEGYGGGAITPIAYLVNPGPKNAVFSYPSVAFSYVNLGSKNLEALTISETLFGRLELSYGADRFGTGNLRENILKATHVDVERDDVWLHTFSARALVLEENSFNQDWLPAFTVGAHLKLNDGIASINNKLGGALTGIGYARDYGADFTATFSKMIAKGPFDRPIILSAGLRVSDAANLGFLGFADKWSPTFEGNIVYLPTDWLLVAYEFRQKNDPYNTIPGLINGEDNWHAIDVSWIINKHATLVGGYGVFGKLADTRADAAWYLQLKFEF